MKIEVKVSKKYFLSILSIIFLIGAGILALAYNPSNSPPANPAEFGHSANEIEGICRSDGTGCPSGVGGGGLNVFFITPVQIYDSTAARAFTTYDASGSVPEGATAVILEARGYSIQNDVEIQIRKNSSSPGYLLLKFAASAGDDGVSAGAQGIFPISIDRRFDYRVSIANQGVKINLVGYIMSGSSTPSSTPSSITCDWVGERILSTNGDCRSEINCNQCVGSPASLSGICSNGKLTEMKSIPSTCHDDYIS